MKVDSMICAMREKSIQKEKQKSDLILYQGAKSGKDHFVLEQSLASQKEELLIKETQTPLVAPKVEEKISVEEQQEEITRADERVDKRADKEEVFDMLEAAIQDIKSKLESDFTIKQPKEIYELHNIDADMKNGILMIDMYRNNMPAEMNEKLKRKSIMDILQAFEISTKDLEQDALQRQEALKSELKELKEYVKESISEKKQRIKKLEKTVTKMKTMISDIEAYYKEQTAIIKEEQMRIDHALKFMKGRKSSKNNDQQEK